LVQDLILLFLAGHFRYHLLQKLDPYLVFLFFIEASLGYPLSPTVQLLILNLLLGSEQHSVRPNALVLLHLEHHVVQVTGQLEQLLVLVREGVFRHVPLALLLNEFLLHYPHLFLEQNPVLGVELQKVALVLGKPALAELRVEDQFPHPAQALVDHVQQPESQR